MDSDSPLTPPIPEATVTAHVVEEDGAAFPRLTSSSDTVAKEVEPVEVSNSGSSTVEDLEPASKDTKHESGEVDGAAFRSLTPPPQPISWADEPMDTIAEEPPLENQLKNPVDKTSKVSLRPLPTNMIIHQVHVFHEHYDTTRNVLPENPAKAFAYQLTISQSNNFRNYTTGQAKIINFKTPAGEPVSRQNLQTVTSRDQCPELGAVYILVYCDGRQFFCVPFNPEIVADDRPDLHMLSISVYSVDMLNGSRIDVRDYVAGDGIYVTKVEPKPEKETEDIMTDFNRVHDAKAHGFWIITEFYLLPRTFKDCIITRIRMKGPRGEVMCVARGVNTHVIVPSTLFTTIGLENDVGTKARAKIMMPQLQPGTFLPSIRPGQSRAAVIKKVNSHLMDSPISPSVTALERLTQEEWEGIRRLPDSFKNFSAEPDAPYHALLLGGKLGYSGVVAAANKNRDLRLHSTKVIKIERIRRKLVITFHLTGSSGAPRSEGWTRGNPVYLEVKRRIHTLEIEDAIYHSQHLQVKAKFTSSSHDVRKAVSRLENQDVVIYQRLDDNQFALDYFPDETALDGCSPRCNLKLILQGIMGGNATPTEELPGRWIEIRAGVRPSKEQEDYVRIMAYTTVPCLRVNAGFGVGKTMMIGLALTLLAADDHSAIQIATAVTDAATTAIAKSVIQLITAYEVQAVRAISVKTWESMEPKNRTNIDFPALYITVLRSYLERTAHDPIDETQSAAYYYLEKVNQMQQLNIHGKQFDLKTPKPKMSLWDLFITIHNPQIIIGTAASIIDNLINGELASKRDLVRTVQIDEASQFPLSSLLTIGSLCPDARFALIGDINQLPPFADHQLAQDIKEYAVGNILFNASCRMQTVNIRQVWRTPAVTTRILSRLFYRNELVSMRSVDKIIPHADWLRLDDSRPLQFIYVRGEQRQAGSSIINQREAEVTLDIVRRLGERFQGLDLGVISFYKAQAGKLSTDRRLAHAFVGTIDGAQGAEFEVTLVLTSRTTSFSQSEDKEEFVEDRSRINVALSRAKRFCLVLVHEESARQSRIWNMLLDAVGERGRHRDDRFVRV